ncbi:MAG: hypothetical protein A2007_00165 [Verrucomicrobia bacterium GWC2_42_7]|nr:MAG: hypothetical protein A2007_00165 [Verrucomicrobia bacterium GWC2_42_7]
MMLSPLFKKSILFLLASLLIGCGTREIKRDLIPPPPPYKPKNVFAPKETIPLRRVVLLPIYFEERDAPFLLSLEDIFSCELIKNACFEVVTASKEEMAQLFGKQQINSSSNFPQNFFPLLNNKYDADGVIFIDLLRYQPYKPIIIGIRAKLVEIKTGKILWAFDNIFDAGSPRVSYAAKLFQMKNEQQDYPLDNSDSILHSPSKFSKYVASEAFKTLP